MKPKNVLIAIGLLTVSVTASANGNTLLTSCKASVRIANGESGPEDLLQATNCMRFLTGIRNMNSLYETVLPKPQVFFCIPEEVSGNQIARVVTKYLEEHPSELHEHEAYLVASAFIEAYPCE